MNLKRIYLPLLFVLVASLSFAQTATTQTTLSSTVTSTDQVIFVASATNILAPATNGGIQTQLVIDAESFEVTAVNGTAISVLRGRAGTTARSHNASAIVWVGPEISGPFRGDTNRTSRSGMCVATSEPYLPIVFVPSGDVYDCLPSGPGANSVWVVRYQGKLNAFNDGAFWVAPGACNTSVSGNSSGTNGLTVSGASNVPVVQASTSASGTNTHTYTCYVTVPSRLVTGRGVLINDIEFFYGVQTSALGTQAATLASGTINSSIVFSKVALPTAGASETASTVTPVRADAGSITITPVVASFNTATTTAGAFYSAKFAPATAVAMNTDNQLLIFTVTLQAAGTSATVTNSPGLLVHYTNTPL